jgi:hypothetical protein
MRLLCIVQCRSFFFTVLGSCLLKYHSMPPKSHIPPLWVLCFGCAPIGGRIFRHHKGITHFFHTLTSTMQQRQHRGSSPSPQHFSFTSGKLISQYLIDTSQISNLPCGFAQCTKAACWCATYLKFWVEHD